MLEPLRASASELTDEQKEAAKMLERDRDSARALYYRRKKSYKELLGIICDGAEVRPEKLIVSCRNVGGRGANECVG